jgi:hypothetical protein
MTAANESQGLKIAVSALITLTVILAVAAYFLYNNASFARARLAAEQDANRFARKAASLALHQYDEMRIRIGTKAEEFDAANAEIFASFQRVDERLDDLIKKVDAAVQTAREHGANGPELEAVRLKVQQAIAAYRNEPAKNYISALERLTEVLENLAILPRLMVGRPK